MKKFILILALLTRFALASKLISSDSKSSPSQQNYQNKKNVRSNGRKQKNEESSQSSRQSDSENKSGEDGCSKCRGVKGWTCINPQSKNRFCQKTCGNGILDSGQECDYALPGRICTLQCVIDLNKLDTCGKFPDFIVEDGQVCDYVVGCYNCLYIDPLYTCTNSKNQLTGDVQTQCDIMCSPGSSTISINFQDIYTYCIQLLSRSIDKTRQLNITFPAAVMPGQNDTYWKVTNIDYAQLDRLYPGSDSDELFIYALSIVASNYIKKDSNGVLTFQLYYPADMSSMFSYIIQYGVDGLNQYQNCLTGVAIPQEI